MPVAYRASAQVFGATTSTSITIPASVQSGDILILQAVGGWVPNAPAGWTVDFAESGSNIGSLVAYKTAGAGDAGAGVTVTWNNAYNHVVNLVAISGGVAVRTPGRHLRSSGGGTGTPGLKPCAAGDMTVYLGGNRQDGGAPALSRGTAVASAMDGSNIFGGVIGYESILANEDVQCTFTSPTSGSGYEYSMMVISGGGTPTVSNVVEAAYLEVMANASSNVQVESQYIEVAAGGNAKLQIENQYLEVMSSNPLIQTELVYLEVLTNPTLVTQFRGWGILK